MTYDKLARAVKMKNVAAWMETSGKIDVEGGIVTPKCNEFQIQVSSILKWCEENDRPARIIILKPRRRGSSTVSVAAGYRRLQAKRSTGCIAGGSHYQNSKLFKMLKIYAENDLLDPGTCEVLTDVARFGNGSEMDRITLANPQAGRAGGYQYLVITEMAFLDAEGVADAKSVVAGLVKTVLFKPGTIIILESTANGASGDYYERWCNGITFEQFKSGRNGFIRVFYAWFQFADLRLDSTQSEGITDWNDITDDEAELSEKWNLDLHQIAWMRYAIREECSGDFDKFCEDFPFDAESAFRQSGRGRFGSKGLEYQSKLIPSRPPEYGVLEYNERADRVSWRPTEQKEARFVRFEGPVPYRAYLHSTDPATGASQTTVVDPDSNSQGVLRKGYIDRNTRQWVETALAMRNICYQNGTRFGNWVDPDVLEHEIWLMTRYYGRCKSVVEVNNSGLAVIELQRKRGDVDMYLREVWNKRDQQDETQYGWKTTEYTREMAISTLARALRESGEGQIGEGIEIRCPWIVDQLKSFVTKKNGRSEAAKGKHDDDVLMLAIGLQCIEHATTYHEQTIEPWIPSDLRRPRDGGSGTSTFS